MRKIFFSLFICFVSIAIISCGRDTVYEQRHSFDDYVWERVSKGRTVTFSDVNIEDTSSVYDIYVDIRHAPFINEKEIKLEMSIISPSGIKRVAINSIKLKDDQDKDWAGDAMGEMIDIKKRIRSFVNFSEKGKYTITLSNMGKYKQMIGIIEIGVIVKKSDIDEYKIKNE